MSEKNASFIFQLTALWAFVEVTLGGMLHALRVPFTGVVVGGTAVAIIGIMGLYSISPWQDILKATGLVILVKAGASPHAPLPAFVAVGFQGVLGAFIFQVFRFSTSSVIVFAVFSMLESALQKLILMTILYGKSLWDALDVFIEAVLKSVRFSSDTQGSYWIVGIYVSIYLIWGIYLGLRMATFLRRKEVYMALWNSSGPQEKPYLIETSVKVAHNRNLFWFVYLLILILVSVILIMLGDSQQDIFYMVFRSMSAIFLVFWVVNPFFSYWMKKKSSDSNLKIQIQQISNQFAFLQQEYLRALQLVGGYSWMPLRYFRAMELLIAVKISQENAGSKIS